MYGDWCEWRITVFYLHYMYLKHMEAGLWRMPTLKPYNLKIALWMNHTSLVQGEHCSGLPVFVN